METLAKVDTLAAWVAEALAAASYAGQESNRVREVPDVRTIRYYTTLGLVDKPAEMRGRTALYGPKHLLQLVAIKRLQAEGLPLVAIQQQLLGASEATLRKIAGLTSEAVQEIVQRVPALAMEAATPRETRFWEREPQWQAAPTPSEPSPRPAVLLPIAPGASLLLEGLSPEKLAMVMQQLGPALEMVRNVLTQGEPPTNTA